MARQIGKPQRLTDRLNIALAKASTAITLAKDNPEISAQACAQAEAALCEAMDLLSDIRRAAEAI